MIFECYFSVSDRIMYTYEFVVSCCRNMYAYKLNLPVLGESPAWMNWLARWKFQVVIRHKY
jgi:hypothetical protein